jgi:hypothetical protein
MAGQTQRRSRLRGRGFRSSECRSRSYECRCGFRKSVLGHAERHIKTQKSGFRLNGGDTCSPKRAFGSTEGDIRSSECGTGSYESRSRN